MLSYWPCWALLTIALAVMIYGAGYHAGRNSMRRVVETVVDCMRRHEDRELPR